MRRRGNMLVLAASAVAAMMAAGAFSIDIGLGLASQARQQAALDAGVIGACYALPEPTTDQAVNAAAAEWLGRNGLAPGQVQVKRWSTAEGAPGVTISSHEDVRTVFARAIGIPSFTVGASASAALGGPTEIPRGAIPFVLPVFQSGPNEWSGLTCSYPQTFQPLTADPARGGPTRILIKPHDGLVLDVLGNGAAGFRDSIITGIDHAVAFNTRLATRGGNMVGPTAQGLAGRIANGNGNAYGLGNGNGNNGASADPREVYIPLVSRDEWNASPSVITLIGFVAARLDATNGGDEVYATFVNKVLATPGKLGPTHSPGVYAPVLTTPPPG